MDVEPIYLTPGEWLQRSDKLKKIRKDKGKTQEDVCAEIESQSGLKIARTTLVSIEQGERVPRPAEIIALCKVYGITAHELLSDRVEPPEIIPQFRNAFGKEFADTSELGKAADKLQSYARSYLHLQKLLSMEQPRKYPQVADLPPNRSAIDLVAQRVALNERDRLGLGRGPLAELGKTLCDEVGVSVFCFPMGNRISGLFGYNGELGACIGINSTHPPERQTWSLAHEYGHFLFTRHEADVEYYTGGKARSFNEVLVDAFAKHLLMPDEAVNRKYIEALGNKEAVTPADLVIMADAFRVSVQAMTLRLEDLGRLRKGAWDRLEARNFKPQEARKHLGIERPTLADARFPMRFRQLVALADAQGKISTEQLVTILDCDDIEARNLVNEWQDSIWGLQGASPSAVDLLEPLR